MTGPIPTVRIQHPQRTGEFLVINQSDFDEATMRLYEPKAKPSATEPESEGTTTDAGTPATPPPAAGADAPAFLQGITMPVLEAMKVADLQALAKQGDVDPKGMKKAELVETIAAMAKLNATESET